MRCEAVVQYPRLIIHVYFVRGKDVEPLSMIHTFVLHIYPYYAQITRSSYNHKLCTTIVIMSIFDYFSFSQCFW